MAGFRLLTLSLACVFCMRYVIFVSTIFFFFSYSVGSESDQWRNRKNHKKADDWIIQWNAITRTQAIFCWRKYFRYIFFFVRSFCCCCSLLTVDELWCLRMCLFYACSGPLRRAVRPTAIIRSRSIFVIFRQKKRCAVCMSMARAVGHREKWGQRSPDEMK